MPKSVTLTKKQIEYIKKNYKIILKTDIAKHLGVSKGIVIRFCDIKGWYMDAAKMHKLRSSKLFKPFTKAEDAFIREELPRSSVKKIAAKIHRTAAYVSKRAKELGLGKLIEKNAIDSRIKKGTPPPNKGVKMSREQYKKRKATMFKKGHIPANTLKDGTISERIENRGRVYKWIRVSVGEWKMYHIYRWEMFRGPVPKGMCLWFKDGDTLNCKINNLELITRAENLRRNRESYWNLPPDLKEAKSLLNKLNKTIHGKKQVK